MPRQCRHNNLIQVGYSDTNLEVYECQTCHMFYELNETTKLNVYWNDVFPTREAQ